MQQEKIKITTASSSIPIKQSYFYYLSMMMQWLFLFFPAALLCVLEFICFYAQRVGVDYHFSFAPLVLFLVVVQLAVLLIKHVSRMTRCISAAAISFVIFYLGVIEPITLFYDQSREAITAIETKRLADKAQLVFYKEQPDG